MRRRSNLVRANDVTVSACVVGPILSCQSKPAAVLAVFAVLQLVFRASFAEIYVFEKHSVIRAIVTAVAKGKGKGKGKGQRWQDLVWSAGQVF